jgi:hypothetical protein
MADFDWKLDTTIPIQRKISTYISFDNPSKSTFDTLKELITISKQRLYKELVYQNQGLIEKGTLQTGDKLPTERELALTLGASAHSVREAIRRLEQQSVVKSIPGSGTFIEPGDAST